MTMLGTSPSVMALLDGLRSATGCQVAALTVLEEVDAVAVDEGQVPAPEEDHRGNRREAHHLDELAHEEHAELHARVLGEVTGHEL